MPERLCNCPERCVGPHCKSVLYNERQEKMTVTFCDELTASPQYGFPIEYGL